MSHLFNRLCASLGGLQHWDISGNNGAAVYHFWIRASAQVDREAFRNIRNEVRFYPRLHTVSVIHWLVGTQILTSPDSTVSDWLSPEGILPPVLQTQQVVTHLHFLLSEVFRLCMCGKRVTEEDTPQNPSTRCWMVQIKYVTIFFLRKRNYNPRSVLRTGKNIVKLVFFCETSHFLCNREAVRMD